MKKLFNFTLALIFTVSLLGLVSCNGIPGAESGDLPAERPLNAISGFVVDDAISGALINVYAFDGGKKNELLASTTTASDGSYSVEIDSIEARPVLFEARGGSYIELATGQQIDLKEDEVLKAVVIHQPGQPLSIMVTPLTHLVVALVEYRLASGIDIEQAITTASVEINELFGFDVASVYPRSIAEQGSDADISAEHIYGFFLSALSSWTKRISEQNDIAPHTVYNSIGLSQVLYKEVASDGLLDGKWKNSDSDGSTDLAMGVVGLEPDVYRISLAQHMLAMAASSANISGVTVEQLLPLAFRFLNNQHRLFAGLPSQLTGGQVSVTADENLGTYRSGLFEYALTLGSPEMISNVSFSVDDFELSELIVPGEMRVPIDTRQFEDGQHTITMVAKDWLGNTIATHSSVFEFDNTDPFVNVTSDLYTKNQAYVLSGNLGDNGTGIELFEIEGQPVTVSPDNSWLFDLGLKPGNNVVSIRLTDLAGNVFSDDLAIALDQTAPEIDTSNGHSMADFSTGLGQPVTTRLGDINGDNPVLIESGKIDLDGIAINRDSLDNTAIPYFAFVATDPSVNSVSTAASALRVDVRYEKNSQIVSDWRTLTMVDNEYLVPLASETLDNSWHQSIPDDEHVVRVKVRDRANNAAERTFSFKADFVVSDFDIEEVLKLNAALFANTSFVDRANLHNNEFAALAYTFTNTTGKAMYIQPSDVGGHVAHREVEQLVREHKVRLQTETDWLISMAKNAVDFCDGASNKVDWEDPSYLNPAEIMNFNGSQWVPVSRPEPSLSAEVLSEDTDTPVPVPESSGWVDVPDFYEGRATFSINVPQGTITFLYDNVFDPNTILPKPAEIINWSLDKDGTNIRNCNNERNFKQRENYSYISEPGYPKDTRTFLNDVPQSFDVSNITVQNDTDGADIDPDSGWYRIPAGDTVTITKYVRTPDLQIDNDISVADETTVATYTPLLYDNAITWFVNRELTITAIHDTGIDNIFSMSTKEIQVGNGPPVQYPISRDR